MHPKVLTPRAWTVVRRLVRAGLCEGWTLAGGTGLALQLGHRISHDLDFFRAGAFEPLTLIDALSRLGSLHVQARSEEAIHVVLGGVRLTFLRAQAPLLFPGTPYRGLVIADPRDIGVMKLVAIGGRGSRKDFIDLYFYLRSGGAIETLLGLLRRRFANIDYNEYHLLKSLVYFDDAEAEPMPRMLRRVTWADVKQAIIAEVRRLA
ncbi:MAG: nucleotidyl transferase AbiEii/AbiGii toxin family protein [candidate division NC10 bacterium]|nr:nucleotidyl transferase AbiEii/AbiGii toxin family protein [candidate division NC10 bacterium]